MCVFVCVSLFLFLRAVALAGLLWLMCVVVEEGEEGGDKPNHVTTDSFRSLPQDKKWSSTASSGKVNNWRTRQRVVLDLSSNLKCVTSNGHFW